MIIHFGTSTGPIVEAIKFLTMSRFSHCALEIDGYIYESTFRGGVGRHTKSEFRQRYPYTENEVVRTTELQKQRALEFLDAQVGKKYDFLSLAAFPLRMRWDEPNAWGCSELVACTLVKAGLLSVDFQLSRVTPRDLWLSRRIRWCK